MKVLIVENEPLVAFGINEMLQELEYAEAPVSKTVTEALKQIEKVRPDIVIVDIELDGERDGIALGEILNEKGIPFVYLTGVRARPVFDKAQKNSRFTVLAKPVHKWQLRNALITASENEEKPNKHSSFIMVSKAGKKIRIDKAAILYLEAAGNNCEIHTADKRYVSSTPMGNVWETINDSSFIKVHKSSVVNLNHVSGYQGNMVFFKETDKVVTMSQSYRNNLVDRIKLV